MPRMFLVNIRQHVPTGLDHATWRSATRILAQAELAAIEVSSLRNDGEPDPRCLVSWISQPHQRHHQRNPSGTCSKDIGLSCRALARVTMQRQGGRQ
jgi:hypothetical protein